MNAAKVFITKSMSFNQVLLRRTLSYPKVPYNMVKAFMKINSSLSFGIPLFVISAASFKKSDHKREIEDLLAQCDHLFSEGFYDQILDILLPILEDNNDEVMWRISQALLFKAKLTKSDAEKLALLNEAHTIARRALLVNHHSAPVHRMMYLMLDNIALLEGTKARIQVTEQVKYYMLKTVELDPTDALTFHRLGVWCYTFADLGWTERRVASLVFAAPPYSRYDEALIYFEKAEQASPFFSSTNLLYLGKTYMKLNQTEKATNYLRLARDAVVRTNEDSQVHKESVNLLKGLGVKD